MWWRKAVTMGWGRGPWGCALNDGHGGGAHDSSAGWGVEAMEVCSRGWRAYDHGGQLEEMKR